MTFTSAVILSSGPTIGSCYRLLPRLRRPLPRHTQAESHPRSPAETVLLPSAKIRDLTRSVKRGALRCATPQPVCPALANSAATFSPGEFLHFLG